MKWQHKALALKLCTNIPFGVHVYPFLQKRFGRLDPNPMVRLVTAKEMTSWILSSGSAVSGKCFLEVGTGHKPAVPIGLFLLGAQSVITLDLHKRLDLGLLKKMLSWMAENRGMICNMYADVAPSIVELERRLDIIDRYRLRPKDFMVAANIRYLAPADAAHTGLPDESVDYHVSVTTLEHIPQDGIRDILVEARRILKLHGKAIHYVDPSDHFQHQDPTISKINFLKFSDYEWNRIAGNALAYCNRLRLRDYVELFQSLSFEVRRLEYETDDVSLMSLADEFHVHDRFSVYAPEELCVIYFKVMLTPLVFTFR